MPNVLHGSDRSGKPRQLRVDRKGRLMIRIPFVVFAVLALTQIEIVLVLLLK